MSSRLLNESPWDKNEHREGDLDERRIGGGFIEFAGISFSLVHPLRLKCHSTVGPIVHPSQKACLQLAR